MALLIQGWLYIAGGVGGLVTGESYLSYINYLIQSFSTFLPQRNPH